MLPISVWGLRIGARGWGGDRILFTRVGKGRSQGRGRQRHACRSRPGWRARRSLSPRTHTGMSTRCRSAVAGVLQHTSLSRSGCCRAVSSRSGKREAEGGAWVGALYHGRLHGDCTLKQTNRMAHKDGNILTPHGSAVAAWVGTHSLRRPRKRRVVSLDRRVGGRRDMLPYHDRRERSSRWKISRPDVYVLHCRGGAGGKGRGSLRARCRMW